MQKASFHDLIRRRWREGRFVCVGLDSDYEQIPWLVHHDHDSIASTILGFNQAIIEATSDLVCAYKINIACYEAQGIQGLKALIKTIGYIHELHLDIPVILDAKRADIGRANAQYAKAAFQTFGADAVTVNPYFGSEAMEPFLEYKNKGIFVLCRTSNAGAGELQDLPAGESGLPLYLLVALHVATHWNKYGNCGLVVGATYPEKLARVRAAVADKITHPYSRHRRPRRRCRENRQGRAESFR